MLKPITGQYECVHSSGVGLDYFTSRIDRLVLHPTGRFTLTIQAQSRAIHAAQSFMKGQVTSQAPETQREGSYRQQDNTVLLEFDDGGFENAQLAPDENGLQVGPNHFTKVSDSTFLPPTHRLQQNMDDIAKGLKVASAVGGFALKAAKTLQQTLQTNQNQQPQSPAPSQPQQSEQPAPSTPSQQNTTQPAFQSPPPPSPAGASAASPYQASSASGTPAIYCDQCGARNRAGKHFCNNCGARLD